MAKDKPEKKERYAHAFQPSVIKKLDKLATKKGTSRAELIRLAIIDFLFKNGII